MACYRSRAFDPAQKLHEMGERALLQLSTGFPFTRFLNIVFRPRPISDAATADWRQRPLWLFSQLRR